MIENCKRGFVVGEFKKFSRTKKKWNMEIWKKDVSFSNFNVMIPLKK